MFSWKPCMIQGSAYADATSCGGLSSRAPGSLPPHSADALLDTRRPKLPGLPTSLIMTTRPSNLAADAMSVLFKTSCREEPEDA
jgi:hypothetical protein